MSLLLFTEFYKNTLSMLMFVLLLENIRLPETKNNNKQ